MGGRRKEWPLENFPSSESRTCVLQVKKNTYVFSRLLFHEQTCSLYVYLVNLLGLQITTPMSGNS